MSLSAEIQPRLRRLAVNYDVLPHQPTSSLEQSAICLNIDPKSITRTIALIDNQGPVLVVLPISYVLDFKLLNQTLGRELRLAKTEEIETDLQGYDKGLIPPLSNMTDIQMMYDEALLYNSEIYFEVGKHDCFIRIPADSFKNLIGESSVSKFSCPVTDLAGINASDVSYSPYVAIRKRIDELASLPAIPPLASKILDLRNRPDASVSELSAIVQLDPCLTAQVIRYARSSLFGYRGKIESIDDAISRVLGFDLVMNMALGAGLGRSFNHSESGPLNIGDFWRHAVYCAALTQKLLPLYSDNKNTVSKGMIYLCGLLHNFGFLIMGLLFKDEFKLLSQLIAANTDRAVIDQELSVLGNRQHPDEPVMNHTQIGKWVMQNWNMPDELVTVVGNHHQADYQGDYQEYVHLVRIANILLKSIDVGDESTRELPDESLSLLKLQRSDIDAVFRDFLSDDVPDLNAIAEALSG